MRGNRRDDRGGFRGGRGGRGGCANRGRPTFLAESRVAFVEKNKTNYAISKYFINDNYLVYIHSI